MIVDVLAFGIAKDILGGSNLQVDMPGNPTVAALRSRLLQDYPAFGQLASLAVALNAEYVAEETVIKPGDEVVIIPPVSGG